VEDNLPEVRLDSAIVIADADGMVRFPDLGYVTRSQFEAADVILINKTDLVSEDRLAAVETRLRGVNPDAAFFRTRRCEIDVALLFGVEGARDRRRPQTSAHAHHDAEVASLAFCADRPLDRERFEAVVEALPPEVYRAKGFLRCPEGGFLFNFVAGRWDLEPFAAKRTEIVFIGRGVDTAQASFLSRLQACEVPCPTAS
jgi:G3E family GTPase